MLSAILTNKIKMQKSVAQNSILVVPDIIPVNDNAVHQSL